MKVLTCLRGLFLLGIVWTGTCLPQKVYAERQDVVVMIHGAGGGGWEYAKWKPVFEREGWKVIAPDLVPVKAGLAKTTFADYVAQVKSWVPRDHKRLVLIGASMGGILALKAAETLNPEQIILINSVPPLGIGKPSIGKPYPAIIRWANGKIKDTRDSLPDGDETTIQWAHPRWRDESGSVLNTIQRGVKVQKPFASVLVVIGKKDTDIPAATSLALAAWIDADVHLYTGTSHIGPLMGRRADEIAEAVRSWLDTRMMKEVDSNKWQ